MKSGEPNLPVLPYKKAYLVIFFYRRDDSQTVACCLSNIIFLLEYGLT